MDYFQVNYIRPDPKGFRVPGYTIVSCESVEKLNEILTTSQIEIISVEFFNIPHAKDWVENFSKCH